MRLDLFLKRSRLVKRRTIALEFCQNGWIELNGARGKPGKNVKPGDRITLHLWGRKKEVEVLKVPKGPVPAKETANLYNLISDLPEEEIWDE